MATLKTVKTWLQK